MIKYAPHAAALVALVIGGNYAHGLYVHYQDGRAASAAWSAAEVTYQHALNDAIERRAAAEDAAMRAYDAAVADAQKKREAAQIAVRKDYPDVAFGGDGPKVSL